MMGCIFQKEATSPLTATSTFTGAARDAFGVGTNAGVSEWQMFAAHFYADQSGTAFIDSSPNGSTWTQAFTGALSASTPLVLIAPVAAQFYRARLTNGSTNQTTLVINTSFISAKSGN
jgi:hypothetical protein